MSLKFYLDSHIAKKIAQVLRANGIDAMHCVDVGLKDATDDEHMAYAAEHGYSLVSSDHDYHDLHWQWVAAERSHFGVFMVYRKLQGEAQINVIVKALLAYWQYIEQYPEDVDAVYNNVLDVR